MIKKQGDVFTTDAYYIAHGCNVDGVMGAGVAKTVHDQFPDVFAAYERHCNQAKESGRNILGSVFPAAQKNKGKMILNAFTQDRPGPNAQYQWVFEALLRCANGVKNSAGRGLHVNRKPVIAMPQIGCGIGGLEWAGVEKIIEAVETIVPEITFEVWEFI